MERRSIAKIAASVGGSKLPPHVSIKDNVFALVDDAGNRVHVGPTLNCVILDMNEKRSRLFWGVDAVYDEDNQSPPLCFSDNGIAPSTRSLEPQAKSCKPDREGVHGCRWSVWGSARSKKTGEGIPACSEGVKLALMLVKLKDKEWIPAIEKAPGTVFFFRVPPASLGAVSSYGKTVASMGKIPEITWTGETDVQTDMGHLVTRITFRGTGTVQFQAVGYITEQIDRTVDEIDQYRVDVSIGRDDEPITGLPAPEGRPSGMNYTPMPGEQPETPALPEPKPSIAAERKSRGRPRKDNDAPATPAKPFKTISGVKFEPKHNPNIVTTDDVRNHAAMRKQEEMEAAQKGMNILRENEPSFAAMRKQEAQDAQDAADQAEAEQPQAYGITDQAPEPPEDVLDQFMNLELK